jgi:hypothetical protein
MINLFGIVLHLVVQESDLSPVPFSLATLSEVGKHPIRKVTCASILSVQI